MKGENERLLYEILNEAYPGQWVNEYKGIEGRKFRFDCANPTLKIAVEIEGAVWMGNKGGHTSGIGYEKDMTKYNLATLEGWRVLRYSPSTLKKNPGIIISHIRQLCGYVAEGQQTLDFDGFKQTSIDQVQIRLS